MIKTEPRHPVGLLDCGSSSSCLVPELTSGLESLNTLPFGHFAHCCFQLCYSMVVGFSLHEYLKGKNPVYSSNQSTITTDSLLVGIALFCPGVASLVVSVAFPEASGIFAEQLDSIHPLRRFPSIQVMTDESERASMIRSQWFSIVVCRKQVVLL